MLLPISQGYWQNNKCRRYNKLYLTGWQNVPPFKDETGVQQQHRQLHQR